MTSPGEIALKLQDQGWRGLLPLLPHDAAPHIRLAPDKAAEVASGRGKAPGRWARAGWSLTAVTGEAIRTTWRRSRRGPPGPASTWACGPAHGRRGWRSSMSTCFTPRPPPRSRRCCAGGWTAVVSSSGASGRRPNSWSRCRSRSRSPRRRSTVVEDRRAAAHGGVAGRRPASRGRRHPPEDRPGLCLARRWPGGDGARQAAAGDAGRAGRDPRRLQPHPVALRPGCRPTGSLDCRPGQCRGKADPRAARAGYALALSAADFVVNSDWSRDDFVAWAYALRGAFGDAGKPIWIRFAAQSVKATNPATAEKVWRDATQAERDGHLRAGAGTVIAVAKEEGWTPPPSPGLPAYFDGGEQDPAQASADLRLAIMTWVEQGLAYIGKGEAPRDAIAGGVGLGKSTVTLEVLAQMAQGVTVHYYAPTLELGDEIVTKAKALGLDAVMIRGREENKKDPVRWPALCLKEDVAATLGRVGRNVWESLCRKEDDFGNVTKCEYFDGCPYVRQFDAPRGQADRPGARVPDPAQGADRQAGTGRGRRAVPHHAVAARLAAAGAGDCRPAVSVRRGGGRCRGRARSRRRHGHPRCRGRQDDGRGRAHARTAPQDGSDTRRSWPNRRPSGPICPMPSSAAAPNGCRRSKRSGWPSSGGCLPRTMTA